MQAINVLSVGVLDNPAGFSNPLQFEIQYECTQHLKDDLEWKLIYVGSAETEKYDQTLDSVLVGPVYPGQYRFVFQADAPDYSKLPPEDIVGVTVLLLTCSYRQKEFIRIGYYVNNEYEDAESQETPPNPPQIHRLRRYILADKPRVTKFPVQFDEDEAAAAAAAAAGTAAVPAAVPTAEDLGAMSELQQAAAAVAFSHAQDDTEMDMEG